MKKLGFGLMRLPLTDANDPASIDEAAASVMVDHFMDNGFSYFDTAYPYHKGNSETFIGKALVQRYPRETYTLASKMPTFLVKEPGDYQRIFTEQLKRCGVSYFDIYLLHALSVQNYESTLKHGGFDYVKNLKAAGKVKHIGFSFHDTAEVLDEILTKHPEMEYVQLQINYMDWDSDTIESRKCYEVAVKHDIPIIVMEPVKGGSLAGLPDEAEKLFKQHHPDWSIASWSVRFAASLDNVYTVLSGMSNLAQLQDNTGYMQNFQPLDEQETAIIAQVMDIIQNSIAIPCTACAYCVDGCPQNIPIPQYFSLYNDQHRFRFGSAHAVSYQSLTQSHGKACDCIACGQCEQHCPQHLHIIETLKTVSSVFDRQD